MIFKQGFYFGNQLVQLQASFQTSADYYHMLRAALQVKQCQSSFVRIGRHNDGGYLMLPPAPGGIAYSFGICDDVSWDSAMADCGYQVYMYDHTIDELPEHRSEFHFFRKGIASSTEDQPPLYPLSYYLAMNGHVHQQHMILKMDVEGAEWGFFLQTPSAILAQFDQVVLELHNLVHEHSAMQTNQMLYGLQKLQETHDLVHLHPNNCGCLVEVEGRPYADVLEATFVYRGGAEPAEMNPALTLPHALDEPNDPQRPEIVLGQWNVES